MLDDRTRQLRVDGLRKAEASLRREGMDPSGPPLEESVKARILSGASTDGAGLAEILAHYQKRADSNRRGQDVSMEYRSLLYTLRAKETTLQRFLVVFHISLHNATTAISGQDMKS